MVTRSLKPSLQTRAQLPAPIDPPGALLARLLHDRPAFFGTIIKGHQKKPLGPFLNDFYSDLLLSHPRKRESGSAVPRNLRDYAKLFGLCCLIQLLCLS